MELKTEFTERMKKMLGDEYEEFYNAYINAPLYSGIRINTLKANAKDTVLSATGELEPVLWCKNGFYADKTIISGNHPLHCAGLFYFQEPSAMAVVEALPLNEGDKVLDLCAAPGGKSTQAAAKLGKNGILVANEIVKKRADILSENIERMGISNAIVTNETPQKLCEKYTAFFDKVIVDAPCSGEGMFRKEPQAVTEWSIEHTVSCGVRQKNILECAVKMLKAGGMLVYSTCTFAPEENEKIAAFLIDECNMELCEPPNLSMLDKGRSEWSDSEHDMSFSKRIFPHHHKGEGHYLALFKKCDGGDVFVEKTQKTAKCDEAVKLWREFESKYLNIHFEGDFVLFGENLYLKPAGIDIDKIKVVRCGLHLGQCRKNRFEPAHALALALKKEDFKNTENFYVDDAEIKAYLTGNVIPSDKSGWSCVCVNGYPLGWGKASVGMLKNHYPKYLRLLK